MDPKSGSIAAPTGRKHRVLIQSAPPPSESLSIPAGVFAFDRAFATPGCFILLKLIQERADKAPTKELVIFGHCDKVGTDDYNKHLSERRAKAIYALLAKDLKVFDAIANEENWELAFYQAMLRGIGCNPGAIDGIAGPNTAAAVRAFQQEYNEDVYHRRYPKAYGSLAVDGIMGPETKAAIRDAYVSIAPAYVGPERFRGPRFAGCSKFNFISDKDDENRRVVIAFFTPGRPLDREFPCKAGDMSACTLDQQRPMRCRFYRVAVAETEGKPHRRFFDFTWLRQKDGLAHLSALTTLPDKTAATFTVYQCKNGPVPKPAPDSTRGDPRPDVGPVLATLEGKIVGGVAFAKWTPPPGVLDPFDFSTWMVPHEAGLQIQRDDDNGTPEAGSLRSSDGLLQAKGMEPPLFAIDAESFWSYSRPPGKRLNRVRFRDDPTAAGTALRVEEGEYLGFTSKDGLATVDDDELDVLGLAVHERDVRVETEPGTDPAPAPGQAPAPADPSSDPAADPADPVDPAFASNDPAPNDPALDPVGSGAPSGSGADPAV